MRKVERFKHLNGREEWVKQVGKDANVNNHL